MICKACGKEGHKAFFCPINHAPNLDYWSSGHRAFDNLPYNTVRWTLLKERIREAVQELQQELGSRATKDLLCPILLDIQEDAFASGWRYCCWKLHHKNHTHEATEPGSVDPDSQATATTDTESEEEF